MENQGYGPVANDVTLEVDSAGLALESGGNLDTIGGDTTSLDAKEVELDLSGAPVQVSLSASTARSTQLAVGRYVVKSDARVFVRQGAVTVDATVTTDFALEPGVAYVLNVTNTTTLGYLAGILAAGTGTLDIQATL